MKKKEMKATASEENRRMEKWKNCGLTEQEMDAAILLIQLSCDDSSGSVSFSLKRYYNSSTSSSSSSEEQQQQRELEKENYSTTATGILLSSNRDYSNHNQTFNSNSNFKSTRRRRVRKFRSLFDLYQSTSPGKRITAHSSNSCSSSSRGRSSGELISDAGSAVIIERRDGDEDDYEIGNHDDSTSAQKLTGTPADV